MGHEEVRDDGLAAAVAEIAGRWRSERGERQGRRHLDPADFDALTGAGWLRAVVPVDAGGTWRGIETSARTLCDALRVLGAADPSVALVSAMHPAVVGYWLATDDPEQPAWTEQRRAVLATALAGAQWGTITSEPGSGGDIMATRTRADATTDAHADLPGRCYLLTGDKHFGSGFGIADFMFTTALAGDDGEPSAFAVDVRTARTGTGPELRVTSEWDGAGMAATQSHAARFDAMPAVRLAWEGPIETLTFNAGRFIPMLFAAVLLGVVDEAVSFARAQLAPRRERLRAFEQVEWSRAEMEHWLAAQAYEGGLRAIECDDGYAALRAGLRAKTAIAELAEQALRRIARVLGGGTFSRRSPVAAWFEDVRALGFLRPPWGLAFDQLFATSFDEPPAAPAP